MKKKKASSEPELNALAQGNIGGQNISFLLSTGSECVSQGQGAAAPPDRA